MMADCVLETKSVIMNRLTYRFDASPTLLSTHMLDLPMSRKPIGPGHPITVSYADALYIIRSSDYGNKIVFSGAVGLNNSPALPVDERDSFFYGPPTAIPTYDAELLECNYCCSAGLPSGHRILPR